MITILEIHQYVDGCVERFKESYNQEQELNNKEKFDFLQFRYSPTMLYFETKYGSIEISNEIQNELMNMNANYINRCQNWINNQKSK